MLLEFRVKNFRCLRDEQVLSMVASSDKTLRDKNTTPTGIKGIPYSLNSAAIYGANAGGKSTLVQALAAMQLIVNTSALKNPQGKLPVTPFMLDPESAAEPVSFEVSFIRKDVRYEYGFSCTPERIIDEYLNVYKTAQPQRWFERTLAGDEYTYSFSSHFKGQKKSWQEQTRPNALFLSTAVQLNSELLEPVFNFFHTDLQILSLDFYKNIFPTLSFLYASEDIRSELCDFLKSADISIADLEIRKTVQNPDGKEYYEENHTTIYEAFFHHSTAKGKAVFPLTAESLGTRNLLYLYTPLFMSLAHGEIVVIDELDSSLHPLVVKKLIQLFHSEKHNPHGAQLIFTTHDTSLLHGVDSSLLRRDQVWFVEKNEDQASELYSLAEFNSTNDRNPERSYFQGRYGGLPFVTFDEE